MRRLLLSLTLLATTAHTATICVGPSATGSGNGSDWNNQAQWSSVTLTRGNVYYLADGSYAGRTLSAAVSGSTLITIRKATVGDATVEAIAGWTSTLGDGNATFTSTISVSSSYWIIDGVKGGGWTGGTPDKTPSNYGFVSSGIAYPLEAYNGSANITDITFSHYAGTAPTADINKVFFKTSDSGLSVNNLTLSYCYGYGYANFTWGSNPGLTHSTWIHEHNVFLDLFCSDANHGEQFNNNFATIQDWQIRYNWVEGIRSGSIQPTMIAGALNNDSGPYYIHGNVFKDLTFADGGICAVNNGYGAHDLSGAVYNNTFINCESSYSGREIVGGEGNNTMTGQNNLFINMRVYEGVPTFSYNGYYNNSTKPSGETSQQVFGSLPIVSVDNVALVAATTAGVTLSSPYNLDVAGNVRGADGTWDRGALEYDAGGGDTTAPSVSITSPTTGLITNNTSVAVSGSSSDNVGISSVVVTNTTIPRAFTVTGTTSWSATVTNAAGTNTIQAIAADAAGNRATNSILIVYDATAPSLSITSPTNGVTYSSSTVTLSNVVSDAIGLASVNSTNTTTGAAITLNGAYTGTATLQSGTNTLLTIAQDLAGNRTTNSISVTYTAPAAAPTTLNVQNFFIRQ